MFVSMLTAALINRNKEWQFSFSGGPPRSKRAPVPYGGLSSSLPRPQLDCYPTIPHSLFSVRSFQYSLFSMTRVWLQVESVPLRACLIVFRSLHYIAVTLPPFSCCLLLLTISSVLYFHKMAMWLGVLKHSSMNG